MAASADLLCVDLEHHSDYSFMGFTCTIQLTIVPKPSHEGAWEPDRFRTVVIDSLALRSHVGSALVGPFTDPRIVKIFHGADSDAQWLHRDFGLHVVNLFDTHRAARKLPELRRFSLAYLLQEILGVNVDKGPQTADWRVRPLPDVMLRYAALDTLYLPVLWHILRSRLLEEGGAEILLKVASESCAVAMKLYEKPQLGAGELSRLQSRLHGSFAFDKMERLAKWRLKTAATEDVSPAMVAPLRVMQVSQSTVEFFCCLEINSCVGAASM